VEQAGPESYPLLLDMYLETAARDGFAVRPRDYYMDAWQSFTEAGLGQALLAYHKAEGESPLPLGGVYLLRQGSRAIYWHGASTDRERNRMPNYLLQWEAIRWAKAQGATLYDMWGAPDVFDESDSLWGVWRFKSGFGGTVVRHVGAWDYPARPFWYWIYAVVKPRVLDLLRSRGGQTSPDLD
jgi:lipid II:glycine glycyltransferase (peptidoglycan interpeptide bridge formation enzyme)